MSNGMSQAWSWRHAVARSSLGPGTKHVLLTLSLKMDETGGSCFPTLSELSELTSLDRKTVIKHLAIAEAAGWLEVGQHGFRGRRWRRNEYVAKWPERELTGHRTTARGDEEIGPDSDDDEGDEGAENATDDGCADVGNGSNPVAEALKNDERGGVKFTPPQQTRWCNGSTTSDLDVVEILPRGGGTAPPRNSNSKNLPEAAAARAGDLEAITRLLIDAAGEGRIQPHGALNLSPILGLIQGGCDLEMDILPIIRARAQRLKSPARSWAYFVEAIREAYQQRMEAGAGLTPPPRRPADAELPEAEARERWARILPMAREKRVAWVTEVWGPMPGKPGCRVPTELIQPGDGEGWAEWKPES